MPAGDVPYCGIYAADRAPGGLVVKRTADPYHELRCLRDFSVGRLKQYLTFGKAITGGVQ